MKTPELIALFETTFKNCLDVMLKKNHDYSKGDSALRNFELVQHLQVATPSQGVLVRLSDKFMRICNLYNTPGQVLDESVDDTISDMINYLVILKATLKQEREK